MRGRFVRVVAVSALLIGGCQAPSPLSWVTLDRNTYRQPAVFVERRSHGTYPPRHVEYYRWMYGADASAVPVDGGPMFATDLVVEPPVGPSMQPEPPPNPRPRFRADARLRPGRRLAPAPPSSIEAVPDPDVEPPLPTDSEAFPSGPPLPSPPEPPAAIDGKSEPIPPSGFVPQPFQNGLAPEAQLPTFTDGEADLPTADADADGSSEEAPRSASTRPAEEHRPAVRLVPELVYPVREAVDYRRSEYVVSGAAGPRSDPDVSSRPMGDAGELGDWPRTQIKPAVPKSGPPTLAEALDELAPTPQGPALAPPPTDKLFRP